MPKPIVLEAYNVEKTTSAALAAGGNGRGKLLGNLLEDTAKALGGTIRHWEPVQDGSNFHLRGMFPTLRPFAREFGQKVARMHDVSNSPSEGRFNQEGDWIARQFFSSKDLQVPPEEYAARHAERWGCFSFHRYRYRDPALAGWIGRLAEILFSEGELERCRQRFLTPEELAEVRRQEAEAF